MFNYSHEMHTEYRTHVAKVPYGGICLSATEHHNLSPADPKLQTQQSLDL